MELAKGYNPQEAQEKWLKFWNDQGYFHARPDSRDPYCIVIPPPNVTGALHMGHALNNTLQDVLIRWRRMQGRNALWMPGTDHAGIATQAVVERLIYSQEKKTRHEIGREELVKRIWEWKDKYEARILGQLRQIGASCDWERTRFTLDPICARAVRETFFKMFKDGLIFRGKRLVNWDPHLQTSVADDETYTEDTKGGFWTFKYPVKSEPEAQARDAPIPLACASGSEIANAYIRFSTTRPETMLGDTAVCVHPSDERYQHLIGKFVTVPLVNRTILIIADPLLADPTLGTGCVKVTPAHDPNDYACYQRNPHIGIINILNPDATINENGGKYQGLDRYKAREAVIADMEALGLFEGKEERVIPLKYSDRSKSPIEPYLSDQWFVRMGDPASACGLALVEEREDTARADLSAKPQAANKGLAQLAMDAVNDGRVKFFPERYKNSYLDWLGEKRDWCISRQLWWGHRIPIWYARCSETDLKKAFAGRDDVTWHFDEGSGQWLICALTDDALATSHSPLATAQDPDVLDTWFSSMLWPHSTLGWPEPTEELKYYYPTSVLVTSRDIITLWVARMVIAGLYNLDQVPFHHVYITVKLMDGFGETMSKSKGNGVDPLDIIDRYGADALRYLVMQISSETQDARLPVANVCPHCDELVPVKQEHMYMRTKKLACPKCKQPFRPGGPWPSDDPELKTAKQASERFEIGRNFANKIWNAARFILMNLDGYTPHAIKPEELALEDRWILSRLTMATHSVTEQLEGYRFSEAARTLYDFIWSEFCDWYLEMCKGRLKQDPSPTMSAAIGGDRAGVQRVLVGVLDAIVRLIHPIMPFVSESIWSALNDVAFERGIPNADPATESVMIAAWPAFPIEWRDAGIEISMARMQELVRSVREVRNRYNIEPRLPLDAFVRCDDAVASDFRTLAPFIQQLAGVGKLECGLSVSKPPQAASHVTPEFEVYVSLQGLIDVATETKRLEKQIADKRKQLAGAMAKLENANFVKNAPPDVVQQQRELIADLQKQIATIEGNIKDLQH